MRTSLLFLLLGVTSLSLAGCGGDAAETPASTCHRSSDCAGSLVCLFGACTDRCAKDRDCPATERCLRTDDGAGCVASATAACTSSCPDGTTCATDHECRATCDLASVVCLIGQACVGSVCVGDDSSHDPSAGLLGAGGSSGAGGASGNGGASGGAGHLGVGGAAGSSGGSPGAGGAAGSHAVGGASGSSGHGGSAGSSATGGAAGSGVGGGAGGSTGGAGASGGAAGSTGGGGASGGAAGSTGGGGASGGGGIAGSSAGGGSSCSVISPTACSPGAVTCQNGTLSVCNDAGSSATTTACAAPLVCSEPAAACLPAGHVLQIEVKVGEACALLDDGTVRCWGANIDNLVASPSTAPFYSIATEVSGLTSARRLGLGGVARCALLDDGTVGCWGKNDRGALGVGGSPSGVSVIPDLCGVKAISGAFLGECAALLDGTVSCWGDSEVLGDGSSQSRFAPGKVPGISDAMDIQGTDPVCAIHSDRTVSCWGAGVSQAAHLTDVSDVVQVVQGIGYRTFFLSKSGAVSYVDPQAGKFSAATQVDLSSVLQPIRSMSAGFYLCFLLVDGSVTCGPQQMDVGPFAQASGLGPGTTVQVSDGSSADYINDVLCALEVDGAVKCLGWDAEGDLGDGKPDLVRMPYFPAVDAGTWLSAQAGTTFAIASTGESVGLGDLSAFGEAAISSSGVTLTDVAMTTAAEIRTSGDGARGVVRFKNGTVATYAGSTIETNDGLETSFPGDNIRQVFVGAGWDAALTDKGVLDMLIVEDVGGSVGVLGDGTANATAGTHKTVPGLPAALTAFTSYSEPGYIDTHICAWDATSAWCWGTNFHGESAQTNTSPMLAPTQVQFPKPVPTAVLEMCAGREHTCALVTQSTKPVVYCWGHNQVGQVGVAASGEVDVPAMVKVSSIKHISCGGNFTWAVDSTGQSFAWGENTFGQLAMPETTVSSTTPVLSTSLPLMASITAGYRHACGLTATNQAPVCWGLSNHGQVGAQYTDDEPTPTFVVGLP